MKTPIAALLLLLGFAGAAGGEEYPARPLRIVVPHPAGGTVDIIARAVARQLEKGFGQAVIVEPKPGANFVIGTEAVARAAPDGHTILIAPQHVVTNPLLRKLPYDGLSAFAPVALLLSSTNVIAVAPGSTARSVEDLVALSRSRPDGINFASISNPCLSCERFRQRSGARVNLVPYQGGVLAAMAVVGGHIEAGMLPLPDAAPHIAAGRLRALAITAPARYEMVKDIPTIAESGYPGSEAMQQWFGAFVPAGTPKPVIERLSAEMRRVLDDPAARELFERIALVPTPLAPAPFAEFLQAESRAYATVIRDAKIVVE